MERFAEDWLRGRPGRRRVVTNAHGRTEAVRGLAVVGHQPLLKPGEQFEYTSWTRIDTPHGTMRGTCSVAVWNSGFSR
jgi:uncharacterized protein affecting Mg2+/Co2+ transport